MIKIANRVFIGNQDSYENSVKGVPGWLTVHACKEPYHRKALGYTGRGAPKDHPEYLIAKRDTELILNLIDTNEAKYIPREIIDAALAYIQAGVDDNKDVLIHCNRGESGSPAIGILYMAINGLVPNKSLEEAEVIFKSIYPDYKPGVGMRQFLVENWSSYIKEK